MLALESPQMDLNFGVIFSSSKMWEPGRMEKQSEFQRSAALLGSAPVSVCGGGSDVPRSLDTCPAGPLCSLGKKRV